MSGLSTHILDLSAGRPASDVAIRLYRLEAGAARLIHEGRSDDDGRARLLDEGALDVGGYRLAFAIGDYFEARGGATASPPFLDVVVIDFGVADPSAHHHVPLLVSPFGYSTYRGS